MRGNRDFHIPVKLEEYYSPSFWFPRLVCAVALFFFFCTAQKAEVKLTNIGTSDVSSPPVIENQVVSLTCESRFFVRQLIWWLISASAVLYQHILLMAESALWEEQRLRVHVSAQRPQLPACCDSELWVCGQRVRLLLIKNDQSSQILHTGPLSLSGYAEWLSQFNDPDDWVSSVTQMTETPLFIP